MANVQEDQESGVVSYGEPDAVAASASPAQNPQNDNQGTYKGVDDFLGGVKAPEQAAPLSPKQYNSVDDFLAADHPQQTGYLDYMKENYGQNLSAIRNTLAAFTTGYADTMTNDLGLSQDTKDWLGKVGIFPDYAKDQGNFLQNFNSAVINPLAAGADMILRLPQAVTEGVAQSMEATGNESLERAARDVRLAPNLMMESSSHIPFPVAEARSTGVIGEGESGYLGTTNPTPADMQAREVSATQAPAPENIHEAARQISPDTFNEYDALTEQREILANQLREQTASRPDEIESSSPYKEEIAQLQSRLENEDLSDRKMQRLQERLDSLVEQHTQYISDETEKPNESIENTRQAYEAIDARMRDMAPDVSAAYREAESRLPQTSATESIIPETVASAKEETSPAAIASIEDQKARIAADVSKQLVNAGRPEEEAQAAGKLVAEHYQARSERFGGKEGTPEEMYSRDGAIIRAGKTRVRTGAREFAQTDNTPYGQQEVLSGAEKITDKELAERKMNERLKGKAGQKAADEGLFDTGARNQRELFQGKPEFYSALEKNLEGLKQGKGSPEQWAGIIRNLTNKGVKQDEIDWSGIQDWLKQQKEPVTKEQVMDYLKAHQIDVQEVEKGEKEVPDDTKYRISPSGDGGFDIKDTSRDIIIEHHDTLADAKAALREYDHGTMKVDDSKFGQHTLPGGKNYRELLMKLPTPDWMYPGRRDAPSFAAASEVFREGHFDEPNVLAHIRFNERVDADGKRTMFIEELQSDWHQKGRKTGYKDEPARLEINKEYAALDKQVMELSKKRDAVADRILTAQSHNEPMNDERAAWHDESQKYSDQINELQKQQQVLREKMNAAITGVPDAPFKMSWPELAFKRALMWAVEHGYDKVAWTTGEQQAARYDLSKHLDTVQWAEHKDGTFSIGGFKDKQRQVGKDDIKPEELPNIVGKDLAQKIIDAAKKDVEGEFSGVDLKVGGEGMKGFYDKILPTTVNKLVKKWGGKVEDSNISTEKEIYALYSKETGNSIGGGYTKEQAQRKVNEMPNTFEMRKVSGGDESVHSVEITPEMRESVQGGLPLFQGTNAKIRLATENSKAIITLMQRANASSFIHETGHQWLEELINDSKSQHAPADLVRDAETVKKWLGVEGNEIATRQHEKFARGFERYMMEGTAPSRALANVFGKFKKWLTDIYQQVTKLRAPINDDIRAVFDRMLSSKPERTVIAPERDTSDIFANIHEADVEATSADKAPAAAESIKAERDTITKNTLPEDFHDIISGRAKEAERSTSGGTELGGTINEARTAEGQTGNIQEPASVGDSGNSPAPKGNKTSGIYVKVPREPLSLSRFLVSIGGVIDHGGELANIGAKSIKGLVVTEKKGANVSESALRLGEMTPERAKLIKSLKGRQLDEALKMATEAGYFPEGTTVGEFLEALNNDLRGTKHYSEQDMDALAKHTDAINHNSDIDRMADELDIKIAGKTKEEFWNEVAEKTALQERDKIAIEAERDRQQLEEDFDRETKEWYESRGEAWEPDQSLKIRTLEDLENDYKQERGVNQPAEGQGYAGEPAGTGQSETVGATPSGQVGERPSDAGRIRSTSSGRSRGKSEPATDSTGDVGSVIDEHGNPKYDLIKKRIEKINTPSDVDNFIRQAAQDNDAFSEARRGTVSHAETYALADAMGVDGNFYKVMQTRKVGEAYNAHQLKAAEALFKTLSVDANEKSKLPKTPENLAAFEAANQKFLMATSHFLGASSEAGRALNILRTMSTDLKKAKDINEFFQKNTGKTANDIAKQMDFMSKLDGEHNQAAFIQASKKAGFKDMMLEYYVNSLLSGPLTHTRYMIGNFIKAIETPLVEIPLAAAHGAIREALGKEVKGDRVYLGEAGAQLYALGKGASDGLRAAATAWKTGQSPFLPGEVVRQYRQNAIPGKIGDVINVPSNAIEAIHGFSKTVRYTQNIAGLAYRTAMQEGLRGEDFNRRVGELTNNPTDNMMEAATRNALKELYMEPADYDSLSGTLVRATNSNALAKIIVPFMKIGTQITKEAFVERTPLGLALSQGVRDNITGKNGGAAQDMQMGKIIAGTSLLAATAAMVKAGMATGDGPNDPRQRAEWLLTHRPNTMTIGDVTIPYQGLGSLGMLMRFAANMTETASEWNDEEGGKLAVSFLEGISKSVLDDNWMRGVKDMLDAMYHPDEYGQRYMQNMATNWLPFSVGQGQISREIDPDQRLVRSHGMENGYGILDAIRDRMPIASEGLLPRRDVFGQPIPNGGRPQYLNDPVVQRMDALKIFPSQLSRKIRGVELTDQQYDDYSRISGQGIKMRLNDVVAMPQFSQMPPSAQIETINKTIKLVREQTRTAIMMQNPDIMQSALAAKRKDQTVGQ